MKKQLVILVMISLLSNSIILKAGKEEARDVATGATAVGAGAALIPTGVTQAAGAGAIIGQGVGLIGMGIWNAFFSCAAYPDPNFVDQATVTAVVFTPIEGSGPEYDAINQSLITGGQLIDFSRLVYASLTKYYGALDAGDSESALSQKIWTFQFLAQLKSTLLAYRNSLSQITPWLIGTDAEDVTATVADVLNLRDEIVLLNAFPEYEQFVFEQMDASSEEIIWAIGEVAQVTGNYITNDDLNLAVIFQGLDTALGFVDIIELMPVEFQTDWYFIPTLSEWGVIILILLLLAVGMVFIYKRQTALAMAGGVEEAGSRRFLLFNKQLYAKVFGFTLLAGLAFLGLTYLIAGEITSADPFGTFVSAAIIAYMIHFMILRRNQ